MSKTCNHRYMKPTYCFGKKEMGFFHTFSRTCCGCGFEEVIDVRRKSDGPKWGEEAEEIFKYNEQ